MDVAPRLRVVLAVVASVATVAAVGRSARCAWDAFVAGIGIRRPADRGDVAGVRRFRPVTLIHAPLSAHLRRLQQRAAGLGDGHRHLHHVCRGALDRPRVRLGCSAVAEVVDHLLAGTVAYQVRGDELIITGRGDGLLIYTPAA
jgi:hypothetical protein